MADLSLAGRPSAATLVADCPAQPRVGNRECGHEQHWVYLRSDALAAHRAADSMSGVGTEPADWPLPGAPVPGAPPPLCQRGLEEGPGLEPFRDASTQQDAVGPALVECRRAAVACGGICLLVVAVMWLLRFRDQGGLRSETKKAT